MRNGQNNNNKRLRNRNNNSNNNNNNNNNNRRGQNPMTRVFESNGPDIKIRGTASHVAEKYVQLARDARSSGDPVAAENYYQHAEHYFRLIAAAQEQFRQNLPQQRSENEMADDGSGDDESESYSNFGAEPGLVPVPPQPFVAREPQREQPQYQPREPREQQPREQREHQPREPRDHQPREHREPRPQPQPQPQFQPQPQPVIPVTDSVDRLPSFITGPQPQISPAAFEGGGERFPPRRRRRPHAPRPDGVAAPAPAAPSDDFNPGNE
ncbi:MULTISPECIES: DUF4167 domain-containing protein [Rhodopseudomonas]|uniref:DUF4167 domain-containing protein n=1 Tax=Rhodopseudomonas palustris TaxID=1076 RepID=A0A0D7F3L4_RHOPL|nr:MULTISPECIES: DUF4167 domain-containing protein [Rhodopseudomonas]KIZ47375.1 hypothetical protein OO17_04685 [Rhodopseudomonas palustris]MDF3814102.1 DUF4167 domain-containing protein [Rhodopseudomonas sp. BAL398]WOK16881.1 DUF4167 domain-containing protein [Rhodopseudomonas sp. BAL398]